MKTDENAKLPRATPKKKAAPRRRAPLAEVSADAAPRRRRGERAAVYFAIAALFFAAAAGAAFSGQGAASGRAAFKPASYSYVATSSRVAGAPEGQECPGLREAAAEMRSAIAQLDRWIAWGEATSKGADVAYAREVSYTPGKCPDGSQYPTYSGEELAEFSDEIAGRSAELIPQLSLMKAELLGLDARLSKANCR